MKKYILALWVVGVCCTPVLSQSSKTEVAAKNFISEVVSKLSSKQNTSFSFTQTDSLFGHSQKPWQTHSYDVKGQFSITANYSYYLLDSLTYGGKMRVGMKYYCDTTLVEYSYGRDKPRQITFNEKSEYPLSYLSLHTPVFVLQDFIQNQSNKTLIHFDKEGGTLVYSSNKQVVSIGFNINTKTVDEIRVLYDHEMYGDVTKTISYGEYKTTTAGALYPTAIVVNELGVNQHTISISETTDGTFKDSILAKIPADYQLTNESEETAIDIEHVEYKPQIHFLNFKHTDDRVLVVELDSFLVVAEAPLESKNGELIIKEAKKIAPNKPIKYFVFGHHHPHYLGGVRPFINNGTTILTHSSNTDYLKQVATFKHTMQPDALQMSNKTLVFEVVDEKKIIKDSNSEMQIIHIGWMSKHTDDYLVYYFPKYKLLFEDDLVWIKKEGGAKPAGERQKGLYDAIKKYGLDVETIIQSWPINYMEVKTEISLKELEKSVQLIKEK